ncbi:MAG: hypothetical protein LH609_02595 [Rudanella sp.]|nr:hypothetical protein [Rudanella sp.]
MEKLIYKYAGGAKRGPAAFGLLLALMLLGSAANAQVKIGANAKTIGASSNLEVEAANGNKTIVDKATGQVTIKDGTQGANKVLTSDANGGSSWQSLTTQRIPETVWIGEQSSADYVVTRFAGFDVLKDRIPLIPRAGSLPGYDPTTKKYTIQQSGYYRIHIGALLIGTLTAAQAPNTTAVLYMGTFSVLQKYDNINSGTGPVLSTFWEAYMPAGTVVDVYVISTGVSNQNVIVRGTFMSVTKLF